MKADTPSSSSGPRPAERFDVVIVGAGISGIGCAHELRRQCPNLSFVILDALEGQEKSAMALKACGHISALVADIAAASPRRRSAAAHA